MDSQTLSSSEDERGHRYWASFSTSSFAKGSTSHAHKGILNGIGPRAGQKAIIKAFRNEPGTEDRCDREMSKSHKAKELAILFNRKFSAFNETIAFAKPLKALMDQVALMDALSITRRRLSGQEWVLIEENMGKKFQMFVKKNGDKCGILHPVLSAFVHFTYHHSGGELVVCGLKGIADETGWRLKIPTIHSPEERYGMSDCGKMGIMQVFEKHKCNHICEGMQLPEAFQNQNFDYRYSPLPRVHGERRSAPVPMLHRQPSAPYDPEVFCDPLSPMIQGYLPSPPPYHISPNGFGPSFFCVSDSFGSWDNIPMKKTT